MTGLALSEIAAAIGAELVGDGTLEIRGLGSLGQAGAGQLSHLSSAAYRAELPGTRASAVILRREDVADAPCAALVTDNPYLAFARASQLFAKQERLPGDVHGSAVIADGVVVPASARIGPNVVVGADVSLGEGVTILANTVVGDRCVLADDVVLRGNVTLYPDVRIGARSIVHSGAVLGADGFGFTPDETGRWETIAQLGGVDIGADVSIGANTCIDCGAIEATVVEDGAKIDNHVQVGHNCRIGAHTLICGQVGLAGSTVIGKHCVFAGRSGAGGDNPIHVCDQVVVSSCTVLSQSVTKPGVYSGSMLFHEHGKWRRNALRFGSLDDLFKRVKRLEKARADEPGQS